MRKRRRKRRRKRGRSGGRVGGRDKISEGKSETERGSGRLNE